MTIQQVKSIVAPVVQTHTSGSTVTLNNDTTHLHVNPSAALASLTITTAAAPTVKNIRIAFGGTIESGVVVTVLTIVANAGYTIVQNSIPVMAEAGDGWEANLLGTKYIRA